MLKPILIVPVLFVLSILLSIQGSTSFKQENRIQSIQTQFSNQEACQNLELSPDFGKIPLYFVPNRGQVDETALFYAKTSRYTLLLTEEGLIFDSTRRIKKERPESIRQDPRDINNPEDVKYDRDVSRLVFVKANRSPEVIPVGVTEHKVNYFIGKDESKWRLNIPTSRAVLYKELYPNIDLKVYGVEKQIEYDFVVKPGAEVSDIGFEYKHVGKTRIDKKGNLVIKTKFGELEHAKPVCYQVIEGERVEIQAAFKRKGDNTWGFQVKDYNKSYELIIDPLVLAYSTYLGGSGREWSYAIAVDSEGAAYVTGYTNSIDFPTKNPIQGYKAGESDIFIAKINSSGSALIYSTYLGGSGENWYGIGDHGSGIAVDSEGMVYVTGGTWSEDFPTKNAIQGGYGGQGDAFIAKIDSSGSGLIYSTYLGGSNDDIGSDLTVDAQGAAYVTGYTISHNFPTQNPIQEDKAVGYDVFIAKIDSLGTALIYSTYLGGSGPDYANGIAVDSKGRAYVTGDTGSADFPTRDPIQGTFAGYTDVFIANVNSSGSALIYSTYLGGRGQDYGHGITVDKEGAAYVTGYTTSTDFPTQNPLQLTNAGQYDAFITKVNASGKALIYSTYLGGSDSDPGFGIGVDSQGAAYVTGFTSSNDLPTKSPFQGTRAGDSDIYIAKVNPSGRALVYSTYLGGSGSDLNYGMAVDSDGAVYVIGVTESGNFPLQNPIQETNAGISDTCITKLVFTPSSIASLTITAGSGGTTNPSPGTYTYDEATEVTIRAIPNSGYTFSGWSVDASGTTNPITIAMDSDKSITANFAKTQSDDDGKDNKGVCFIATACYGTPMAEEVKTLCAFRDQYLLTNPIGKALVKIYYSNSSRIADFIRDKEYLKAGLRECLKPVVKIMSQIVSR
jgi:uncharacterized repeat protein (TIGR02543 family)